MSNPPAPQRANNFDAVRLAAALSVVFSHSFLIAEGSEANEPFVWITGNQSILGLVGVFVFFVISGYLVTESYCRHPAAGRFAVRRMLRIYPGLLVNVLVCAFLIGPLVSTLPLGAYLVSPELRQFLVNTLTLDPGPLHLPGVLFADNSVGLLVNGSLWTLRYEVMMYLMILAARRGASAAPVERDHPGRGRHRRGLFRARADAMGRYRRMGLVCRVLRRRAWCSRFLRDRLVFDWRYALLALAGLVAFVWLGRLIMLFPLAGAYLVIYLARRHDPWLDYSKYAGDLSYGLYIYGWPAEQLVMYLSGGRAQWWQVFFGSLAIALPAAWLSWHGVEKWALLWGRRLPARRLAAAAGE